MIRGTGIDIVDVERIARSMEKNEAFGRLVFSESEIIYCTKNGMPSFAGRFAAKEAFLKAVGTGWRGELNLFEIAFENDESGKPHLELSGRSKEVLDYLAGCAVHVTISHTATMATAMVIIEDLPI